jgi:predicted negative regulator of RcsB-dependent stress response
VDDFLTDQQRADQVRSWLRSNGPYMLLGVVLGLGGLFGWQKYRTFGDAQTEKASALYEELQSAARAGRAPRVEEIAAQLAKDYARTPYVDLSRLILAKLAMDRSAPEEAGKYLQQVAEGNSSPEIRNLARLRWGRVLLQAEKYDDALKILELPSDSAFAAKFHEVRGDVRAAQGKAEAARAEYEEALKSTEAGVIDKLLVEAKRDSLGVVSPAAASPPKS